ncbi:MAG: Rpn family recombination-promoting nuclease/putative transposase [Lachnospiraceae bacterium]|nr:Rpn family recombination-promoting nuclease/putative transposase [Lachnospiraceae bacterium]
MGVIDTEGKRYLFNNDIFADAFNYLVYGGKQVIKADELREIDTTELALPYGNGAKVPVQKYRDILKLWDAKMDDAAIYVILGTELQDKVHYGMPVKDGLYDMLGYSNQIDEIRRSYRNQNGKNDTDGELVIDGDSLKIKLTSEEFLSGLRKGDKLIPIITAVVYLGDTPWDGPRSLHEMLDFKNDAIKDFVPDYKINLISPADMDDDEFTKFNTDLGFAMNVIKHQSDNADEIIGATNHRKIDRDTAVFLNTAARLHLEYEEKIGGIDMCKALDNRIQKEKIISVMDYMKDEGKSETDIINKIIERFHVTKEYVLALMSPQKA